MRIETTDNTHVNFFALEEKEKNFFLHLAKIFSNAAFGNRGEMREKRILTYCCRSHAVNWEWRRRRSDIIMAAKTFSNVGALKIVVGEPLRLFLEFQTQGHFHQLQHSLYMHLSQCLIFSTFGLEAICAAGFPNWVCRPSWWWRPH